MNGDPKKGEFGSRPATLTINAMLSCDTSVTRKHLKAAFCCPLHGDQLIAPATRHVSWDNRCKHDGWLCYLLSCFRTRTYAFTSGRMSWRNQSPMYYIIDVRWSGRPLYMGNSRRRSWSCSRRSRQERPQLRPRWWSGAINITVSLSNGKQAHQIAWEWAHVQGRVVRRDRWLPVPSGKLNGEWRLWLLASMTNPFTSIRYGLCCLFDWWKVHRNTLIGVSVGMNCWATCKLLLAATCIVILNFSSRRLNVMTQCCTPLETLYVTARHLQKKMEGFASKVSKCTFVQT